MKMIQRLMFEVLSSRQRCHVGRRSHDSELRDKNPRPKDDSKRSKYYTAEGAQLLKTAAPPSGWTRVIPPSASAVTQLLHTQHTQY